MLLSYEPLALSLTELTPRLPNYQPQRTSSMLAGELVHQGHLLLQEVGSQLVEAPVHVFLMPEALVVRAASSVPLPSPSWRPSPDRRPSLALPQIAQMEQLSTKLDAQHKLSLLSIEPVAKLRVQDVLDMGGAYAFPGAVCCCLFSL